jgi:hypothetical protein
VIDYTDGRGDGRGDGRRASTARARLDVTG